MNTCWQIAESWSRNKIPNYMASVLLDTGSSTQWLRAACGKTLKLKVINQAWKALVNSEYQLLKIRNRSYALVREVEIRGHGKPWMLARAVFPRTTLIGHTKFISKHLDDRPLGDLLFQEPTLKRSAFELSLMNLSTCEYSFVHPYSKKIKQPQWARRSIFWYHQKPILLTEIFLPALMAYYEKARLVP